MGLQVKTEGLGTDIFHSSSEDNDNTSLHLKYSACSLFLLAVIIVARRARHLLYVAVLQR